MIKRLAIRIGLWLAHWGGWVEPVCKRQHEFVCPLPHECHLTHLPPTPLVERARLYAEHVAKNFPGTDGEFKRREVLRAMLNTFPDAKERDCSFAIEQAIQEYHAVR